MGRSGGKLLVRAAAASVALAAMAWIGIAWAAGGPGGGRSGGSVGPLVGKPAPDFELPLLKEETNAKGEKVNRITDEKVKISSFRGKKAVVLILSSYT